MVSKPEVLMIGPYPAWDMEELDARYVVHKLWEATDRDHMVESNRSTIQAIATRGRAGRLGRSHEASPEAGDRLLLRRRH
jgi:D-3-phosphoglycerate dehydrogenase